MGVKPSFTIIIVFFLRVLFAKLKSRVGPALFLNTLKICLTFLISHELCHGNDPTFLIKQFMILNSPESEFNEFEPGLKSAKNWFQLSAGLNLETLNTILRGTNLI